MYRYDDWVQTEEWTFVYSVLLGFGHVLSFLTTRWSFGLRTLIENTKADSLENAKMIRVIPRKDKGKGDLVELEKRKDERGILYAFVYQRDTYVLNGESTSPSSSPQLIQIYLSSC